MKETLVVPLLVAVADAVPVSEPVTLNVLDTVNDTLLVTEPLLLWEIAGVSDGEGVCSAETLGLGLAEMVSEQLTIGPISGLISLKTHMYTQE